MARDALRYAGSWWLEEDSWQVVPFSQHLKCKCCGSGFILSSGSGVILSSESVSGSRVLMTKNWKKIQMKLFYIFFRSKKCNFLI
jgi:hypothetical protein